MAVTPESPPNNAVYAILIIYIFGMFAVSVLGWAKNQFKGSFKICGSCTFYGDRQESISRNFMGAGSGLSRITWFFTMLSTLWVVMSKSMCAQSTLPARAHAFVLLATISIQRRQLTYECGTKQIFGLLDFWHRKRGLHHGLERYQVLQWSYFLL